MKMEIRNNMPDQIPARSKSARERISAGNIATRFNQLNYNCFQRFLQNVLRDLFQALAGNKNVQTTALAKLATLASKNEKSTRIEEFIKFTGESIIKAKIALDCC